MVIEDILIPRTGLPQKSKCSLIEAAEISKYPQFRRALPLCKEEKLRVNLKVPPIYESPNIYCGSPARKLYVPLIRELLVKHILINIHNN